MPCPRAGEGGSISVFLTTTTIFLPSCKSCWLAKSRKTTPLLLLLTKKKAMSMPMTMWLHLPEWDRTCQWHCQPRLNQFVNYVCQWTPPRNVQASVIYNDIDSQSFSLGRWQSDSRANSDMCVSTSLFFHNIKVPGHRPCHFRPLQGSYQGLSMSMSM